LKQGEARLAIKEGMRALHPNQIGVLRVRAALFALAVLAAAAFVDLVVLRDSGLPAGLVIGAAFLLALAIVLVMPRRRYRAWSFRMDEDELRIGSGLLVRSVTVVPFGRVQHSDVVRGPAQRRYGVASLVLHTAGTRSAATILPGIEAEEAERMRDHVRARIREDLA
jgi:membrane protein YdbS with pleckstrin-like domain